MESCWDDGVLVWSFDDGILTIKSKWLYKKLRDDFDFDIFVYSFKKNFFYLSGSYPKNKALEIKKFLYDSYPIIKYIILTSDGIEVNFNTDIKYI
jgi:uncharacterized pyridoxamine 5'-phosphate oxidase family protein